MPSLAQVDNRFTVDLSVIEGGSGVLSAVVTEPSQGEVPSYIFDFPRRLARVSSKVPCRAGMIVKDLAGHVYLLAEHGVGQMANEVLFRNFRMIRMDGQFSWQRPAKTYDAITRLPESDGLADIGEIWGVYEPAQREQFDRKIRTNFEEGRFVTNADIKIKDVIDGKTVMRVEDQLGIKVAMLG